MYRTYIYIPKPIEPAAAPQLPARPTATSSTFPPDWKANVQNKQPIHYNPGVAQPLPQPADVAHPPPQSAKKRPSEEQSADSPEYVIVLHMAR